MNYWVFHLVTSLVIGIIFLVFFGIVFAIGYGVNKNKDLTQKEKGTTFIVLIILVIIFIIIMVVVSIIIRIMLFKKAQTPFQKAEFLMNVIR